MQHNTVHKGPIINEISRSLRLGIAMNTLLFRNAPLLWFSMVFSPVLFGMLSMCTVLLPKYLVEAITGEYGIAVVLFLLACFALSASLHTVLAEFRTYILDTRYQKLSMWMKQKLIERYQRNTLDILESNEENIRKNKALYAIENVDIVRNCCSAWMATMEMLIFLLFSVTVVAKTNVWMMILLVVATAWNIYLDSKRKNYDRKCWDLWANDISKVRTIIRTAASPDIAKDVRIFGAKDFMVKKVEDCNAVFTERLRQKAKHHLFFDKMDGAVELLKNIILYLYSVFLLYHESISLGDFAAYVGVIRSFIHNTTRFGTSMLDLKLYSSYLEDLLGYLNTEVPQKNSETEEQHFLHPPSIEFDHVFFRYPGQEDYAVKDVSFTLRSGEHCALVGENGAGKSTLVKLMLGLYKPERGHVFLNGRDLCSLSRQEILGTFSVAFQGEKGFPFSIVENVCMKEEEYITPEDERRADAIFRKLDVAEVIDRLPNALHTPLSTVYEGGVNLSKGQQQKLTIARVLWNKQFVVVMDEPNAALDARAEMDLNRLLEEDFQGCSVICVSHRLTTVQKADRILVMHAGALVESGPHEALMREPGRYKKMFEAQASLYEI